MLRLFNSKLLGLKQVRILLNSQAFFELYGRRPEMMDVQEFSNEFISSSSSSSTNTNTSSLLSSSSEIKNSSSTEMLKTKWKQSLEEFFAQIYVSPNDKVNQKIICKVLENLAIPLYSPSERQSRYNLKLWEHAMNVYQYTEKKDLRSTVLLITILYYSSKYDLVIQKIEEGDFLEVSQIKEIYQIKDISYKLRLITIYILASSFVINGKPIHINMMKLIQKNIEKSLDILKKEKLKEIKNEYKLFIYALDWYFSNLKDSDEQKRIYSMFIPLIPLKIRSFIFNSTLKNSDINYLPKKLSPSTIFHIGKKCFEESNKKQLRKLFIYCQKYEEISKGFKLFQLSNQLGNLISQLSGIDSNTLLDIVKYCGTSLNYEVIAKIGIKRECRDNILKLISRMEGPEAYFALRQVLFHCNSKESLKFQEKYGDIFTGNSNLIWQNAFQSMMETLSKGDMQWRKSLPTVLRLMSDAGEFTHFFQLLKETSYTTSENNNNNISSLMIASALAQATRRSGEWWRSTEVLDIIISCDIPHNISDDLFLKDACVQTMYALRDAKRWKESLQFYSLLSPIMPNTAYRVLCSVVCGMSAASPWEKALQTIQTFGNVPDEFMKTLMCARDPNKVEITNVMNSKSWRYMLQGYAEGGHWKHALNCIKERKNLDLNIWISVLRSAQRATFGSLPSDYFLLLEKMNWNSTELLRLCVLIAEGHGYLKELYEILQKYSEYSLVNEYKALVQFLINGNIPSIKQIFTDTYVIHRLVMSPVSCVKPMIINISWTRKSLEYFNHLSKKDMELFIQNYYKVHPSCLLKKSLELNNNKNKNNFKLHAIPPQTFLKGYEMLLSVQEEIIVAYKPSGLGTHSYARSVVQKSKKKLMYSIAYLLNPSSSGLILLIASTIPTKSVFLEMKILLRICKVNLSSLPLLSTEFFIKYSMEVLSGPSSNGCILVEATCYSDSDGLLAGSFYRLKENMITEGWSFWESETNNNNCEEDFNEISGECVHLSEITVFIHHLGFKGEPMRFFSFNSPVWAQMKSRDEEE